MVLRVTDAAAATNDVAFTFTITAPAPSSRSPTSRAPVARSTYAGAGTAQGTESSRPRASSPVLNKGFATSGATTCGLCGFTIQPAGSGGAIDLTPGASDGIFVYGFPSFQAMNSTGGDLAVGQSVRVTRKDQRVLGRRRHRQPDRAQPHQRQQRQSIVSIPALTPAPPPLTALPALAEREAHESEIVSPTDVVVITDTYNFETTGELGVATGGKTLVQPAEICPDDNAACITAAQDDIRNRGWFLDDGSTTAYLTFDVLQPAGQQELGHPAAVHGRDPLRTRGRLGDVPGRQAGRDQLRLEEVVALPAARACPEETGACRTSAPT